MAGDKDKDNTAAKSSSAAASDSFTETDKNKEISASVSRPYRATAGNTTASAGLESERQQRREQLREQQERMEARQADPKAATTPRDASYVPAPDSRVPKNADGSTAAPKSGMGGLAIETSDERRDLPASLTHGITTR